MTAIIDILAREILDSRGNPTVEVDVFLDTGAAGRAAGRQQENGRENDCRKNPVQSRASHGDLLGFVRRFRRLPRSVPPGCKRRPEINDRVIQGKTTVRPAAVRLDNFIDLFHEPDCFRNRNDYFLIVRDVVG